MLYVCMRNACGPAYDVFRSLSDRICFSHPCQSGLYTAEQPMQKYQTQIRNTYAPVPRPPQTRAAHFKRPYQN